MWKNYYVFIIIWLLSGYSIKIISHHYIMRLFVYALATMSVAQLWIQTRRSWGMLYLFVYKHSRNMCLSKPQEYGYSYLNLYIYMAQAYRKRDFLLRLHYIWIYWFPYGKKKTFNVILLTNGKLTSGILPLTMQVLYKCLVQLCEQRIYYAWFWVLCWNFNWKS